MILNTNDVVNCRFYLCLNEDCIYNRHSNVFFFLLAGGWCESYLTQGAHCNPFDELNGHCGCGPGLACTYYPPPTSLPPTPINLNTTSRPIVNRSLRPGKYLCSPITY